MIYVGMDVHMKTTTYCAIDEEGKVKRRATVPGDEAGLLKAVQDWLCGGVEVALETGCMTWCAVDVLRKVGIEPVVVDARRLKMISDSKKKSDRHDVRALADGLRGGLAQRIAVSVPDQKTRRARALMQTRQHIVKQCAMSINMAKAMLRSVGVEPKRVSGLS